MFFLINRQGVSGTAPTVTAISAASGEDFDDFTDHTVTGTNFVSGCTCQIHGTNSPSVTYVNSTTLTVKMPQKFLSASSMSSVAGDVTVTNPDTLVGTLTNGFTYTWSPYSLQKFDLLFFGQSLPATLGSGATLRNFGFTTTGLTRAVSGGGTTTRVSANGTYALQCAVATAGGTAYFGDATNITARLASVEVISLHHVVNTASRGDLAGGDPNFTAFEYTTPAGTNAYVAGSTNIPIGPNVGADEGWRLFETRYVFSTDLGPYDIGDLYAGYGGSISNVATPIRYGAINAYVGVKTATVLNSFTAQQQFLAVRRSNTLLTSTERGFVRSYSSSKYGI